MGEVHLPEGVLRLALVRVLPELVLPDNTISEAKLFVPGLGETTLLAHLKSDKSWDITIIEVAGAPLRSPVRVHVPGPQIRALSANDPTYMREPVMVDEHGEDIYDRVATQRYPYELTCGCGRKRYITKNNLQKVSLCRICAKVRHRATRTEWQRHKRFVQSWSLAETCKP